MTAGQWLMLVLLAAIWGSAFFFGKLALAEVGPLTIVAVRTLIGGLLLLLIVRALRQRMPDARRWRRLVVLGLLGTLVPFSMIFWAQQYIASGLAGILNATVPIFSIVLAHFLTGERLTPLRIGGALAGFAGVAVMLGLEALHGAREHALAQAAVLAGALCYALAAFYARKLADTSPLVISAGMLTVTLALSTPLAAALEQPWLREGGRVGWPGPVVLGALLALGLLCTALAYVLYFRMLQQVGPANVLLATYLIPVSALLLGILVLGERLEPRHFGGMALIALGLALIDGRLPARLRRG